MKIWIAYDGSECSEAAIEDLKFAGLPEKGVEATLVCIADYLPLSPEPGMELLTTPIDTCITTFEAKAAKVAERGVVKVRQLFPGWDIGIKGLVGNAQDTLEFEAEQVHPDLLVMGRHSWSKFHALFIWSVAEFHVAHTQTSIRVSRKGALPTRAAPTIVIGIDWSQESSAAVSEVVRRSWPADTCVDLVHVVRQLHSETADGQMCDIPTPDAPTSINITKARKQLHKAGLLTSTFCYPGEPAEQLVHHAHTHGADAIFLGAQPHGVWYRFFIGSVATDVARAAECAVEIIRPDGLSDQPSNEKVEVAVRPYIKQPVSESRADAVRILSSYI